LRVKIGILFIFVPQIEGLLLGVLHLFAHAQLFAPQIRKIMDGVGFAYLELVTP
jgi:hypothetical protein